MVVSSEIATNLLMSSGYLSCMMASGRRLVEDHVGHPAVRPVNGPLDAPPVIFFSFTLPGEDRVPAVAIAEAAWSWSKDVAEDQRTSAPS